MKKRTYKRMKKKTRTRIIRAVSIVFLLAVPFTGMAALEPEIIRTKHGHLLV